MPASGLPSRGAEPTAALLQSAVPTGSVIEASSPVPLPPNRVALAVATAGPAGYAPFAPGTAGAAVGVALHLALAGLGLGLWALTVLALTALGVWASDEAERVFAKKDDGRIVIDEVVGQLVSLGPLVALGGRGDWGGVVTGFVAFRCFDVWKPGPVRWAERRFAGGAGVMLDDVAAGLLAAVVVTGVALWGPWR